MEHDQQIAFAFGRVLRKVRLAAELTQEKLAFEAELQRKYISMLELGENQPKISTVFRLAMALGMSATELIFEVEKELADAGAEPE